MKSTAPEVDKQHVGSQPSVELKGKSAGRLESLESNLKTHIPHLHVLFETSPDCLKLIDAEGKLLSMNANGCRLMEIEDFSHIKGRTWVDLWPEPEQITQALEEARTKGFASLQAFCPTAKGTPKWWDVQITRVVNEATESVSFLGASRDISALKETEQALKEANALLLMKNAELSERAAKRKGERDASSSALVDEIRLRSKVENELYESEQRLRSILNTLHEGLVVQDDKGRIIESNPRAEVILGLTREQMEGKTSTDPTWRAIKEDSSDFPGEEHYAMVALKTGQPQRDGVMGVYKPDGSLTWILVNSSPIVLNDKEVSAVVSSFTDITEMRNATQELKTYSENLERSNRDLQDFAYVASHDLQEPLRMVSSYVQLLERRYGDELDDKAKEYIHFAVDGAARMKELISDLLVYSRVGTQGDPFSQVEAEKLLDRALANLEIKLKTSNANVTREALPMVYSDAGQLTAVLQNLIDNALKYSTDIPQVHVSAEAVQEEGKNVWRFAVQDKGIGMNEANLEAIFTLFTRLHTRDTYSGNGIGLTLCRRILERHGGRIWAESKLGQGTTFYFTLPR